MSIWHGEVRKGIAERENKSSLWWTVHREKGNGQLLRVRLKREEEGSGSWKR